MVAITKNKKQFLTGALLIVVALLLACAYLFSMPPYEPVLPTTTVTIGQTHIEVELATTEAERALGLSGRTGLPAGKGMFFIFDTQDNWGIWMKDMQFSIDILWADQHGTIVTIEHNVAPSTYPATSFYPSVPASYVLELPAGFAKQHGIAVGGKIVVQ